ncbi:MAG: FMN-binding protein [Gammaproteobacteria bacterium]|nr:FMN-binding protein [Gammaproteobacteria bacterium]
MTPVSTGWRLGIIAATIVGAVLAVAHGTAPMIERNQRAALAKDLADLTGVPLTTADLPSSTASTFVVCAERRPVTVAIARVAGYGGDIELLIAVDDRVLRGARITRHQETPGIGDFIDRARSPWIEQFAGRTLDAVESWPIDGVTGATITTRAVIGGVKALALESRTQVLGCET